MVQFLNFLLLARFWPGGRGRHLWKVISNSRGRRSAHEWRHCRSARFTYFHSEGRVPAGQQSHRYNVMDTAYAWLLSAWCPSCMPACLATCMTLSSSLLLLEEWRWVYNLQYTGLKLFFHTVPQWVNRRYSTASRVPFIYTSLDVWCEFLFRNAISSLSKNA
jgi:hypothetical protein